MSGISVRVVGFCLLLDIICSIFMSCLGIAARVPLSTLNMSTRPLACWKPGSRRPRRPACWPGGWAAGTPGAPLRQPGRGVGPGPGPRRGHGVHRPASGPAGGRGPGARPRVWPHGLLGRRAGAGGVPRPRSRDPSAQVRELRVETEHVFSRHGAAEMSVAYGILVPQRRARTAAGAPGGGSGDGDGDLRAGLQRPAGEGTRRSAPSCPRCASTPRPAGLTSRKTGSSPMRGTPGRRWPARAWRRCGTWPRRAASTPCWSTRRTGWPASSPTRRC